MFERMWPVSVLHGRLDAAVCRLCRQTASSVLCDQCEGRFAASRPRCGRCALPLPAAAPQCLGCMDSPPPWARAVCAHDYAFPWDRLIADFKFHGEPALAGRLAQSVVRAVSSQPQPAGGAELLVPVPLSAQRLRERGYNQAWELARRVAAAFGLDADASLLQRPVDSAHQAALDRTRRETNLRSAFMVDPRRRAPLQGRHVAVVDDVMTTGATFAEATRALLRAGAASVQVWAVARTA